MAENDLSQQDYLTLSELACVFAYFFLSYDRNINENLLFASDVSPMKLLRSSQDSNNNKQNIMSVSTNKSITQISITTMQDILWRGSNDQVTKFIQKICTGRSKKVIDMITSIRDQFDDFDKMEKGEIYMEELYKILNSFNFKKQSVIDKVCESLKEHIHQQGRNTVLLPEIFEYFGMIIQETGDAILDIKEVYALLRTHLSTSEVRNMSNYVIKLIDNIILHDTENKFWSINTLSDVSADCGILFLIIILIVCMI